MFYYHPGFMAWVDFIEFSFLVQRGLLHGVLLPAADGDACVDSTRVVCSLVCSSSLVKQRFSIRNDTSYKSKPKPQNQIQNHHQNQTTKLNQKSQIKTETKPKLKQKPKSKSICFFNFNLNFGDIVAWKPFLVTTPPKG